MDVISTGIPTLDKKLLNGVAKGSMILIESSPGSGMELFAKQIVQGGDKKSSKVLFATAETEADIEEVMKKFGWKEKVSIHDIGTQYYQNVVVKELESARLRFEGLSENDIARLGMSAQQKKRIDFLQLLSYEISKLKPPFRIVIDSVDFFLQMYPYEQVMVVLRLIKAHVQQNGGMVAVTMHKDIYGPQVLAGIETLADVILDLDVRRLDDAIEHKLIVRKVRNHPEKNVVEIYAVGESGIQLV